MLESRRRIVASRFNAGIEAIGAADEERDVVAVVAPRFDASREVDRREVVTTFVQCDPRSASRQCLADALGLGRHHRFGASAFGTRLGPHFLQHESQIGRHAGRVVVERRVDPRRHATADRDDHELHRAR